MMPRPGSTLARRGTRPGNLPAALEALRKSAELDDRNDRVFYLMGRVLDRMGRPDEAMPMYRRSKELSAP